MLINRIFGQLSVAVPCRGAAVPPPSPATDYVGVSRSRVAIGCRGGVLRYHPSLPPHPTTPHPPLLAYTYPPPHANESNGFDQLATSGKDSNGVYWKVLKHRFTILLLVVLNGFLWIWIIPGNLSPRSIYFSICSIHLPSYRTTVIFIDSQFSRKIEKSPGHTTEPHSPPFRPSRFPTNLYYL